MSLNLTAALRARFWKQFQGTTVPLPALPDYSGDNNYQSYALNSAGTGIAPTFKELNSSNQFELNAGHTIVGGALSIGQITPPGNPTAVVNGTAGTTNYTWNIVARSGNLSVRAATAVAVTTGPATLTGTNSVTLTWVPSTANVQIYDIYRTASSGTPSTTGRIGTHIGAFATSSTGTMTFTDTGLVGDGSTIPATNTSGGFTGDLNVYGNFNLNALATPATPIARVNGTAGSTTVAYKIVAYTGSVLNLTGHTAASAAVTVTTAAATLTAVNSVTLVWQPVVGATIYGVFRTTAAGTPSTTGLIGTTTSSNGFTDTGLAGDSTTAPTTNTTGQQTVPAGSIPGSALTPTTATGLVPLQVAHAKYDFAVDGGGAPGLITPAANATIPANSIIYSQIINWTTPGTGVTNTTSIGTTGTGGGVAILQAATAVASLTGIVQGVIVPQTASGFKKLTTAGTITLTTATAALTAGVCEVWVYYVTANA